MAAVASRLLGTAGLAFCAIACAGMPSESQPPVALPFHVIAHRGASAEAPENTLPAFELARRQGALAVELDVQLSRDDRVLLFHDSTLDEKTDLSGRVRDHDSEVLLGADIGRWFDATHPNADALHAGTPLMTLDALFDRFGNAFHYHVELKSEDAELPERVLELVRARDLAGRVTVTSFQLAALQRTRILAPRIPIAWLSRDPTRAVVDQAVAEGFTSVAFPAATLDASLVRYAHDRGLEIRAWGVKTPEDMERVIRVGANGMTIDWPDRLIGRLIKIWETGGQGAP